MTENEVARVVVAACYQIHHHLGPGLLESVYEAILAKELEARGLGIQRQLPVPIVWNGMVLDEGFRADLVVEGLVVLELKSVEKTLPVHSKQLLTYLRLMDLRLGLLVNFGEAAIKDGLHRIVNGLPEGMGR